MNNSLLNALGKYKTTKSEADKKKFLIACYDQYFSLVYAICFGFFKDGHLAYDLTHDTFEKIIAKVDYLPNHSNSALKNYIYKMALNHCRDIKKKKYHKNGLSNEPNPDEVSSIEQWMLVETTIDIQNSLKSLKKEERDIISYHLAGFKYHEIAQFVNKSERAVANQVHRIKKKLKEKFMAK